MKITSRRTLHHMENAAELRVQGATWDTIAQYLGPHKRVLPLPSLCFAGEGLGVRALGVMLPKTLTPNPSPAKPGEGDRTSLLAAAMLRCGLPAAFRGGRATRGQ